MREKNTTSGLRTSGVLQIIFIVLKLVKVIDWSWWWVFAPTWISAIISVVLLSLLYLVEWKQRKEE